MIIYNLEMELLPTITQVTLLPTVYRLEQQRT
jgi:hypothetical protein